MRRIPKHSPADVCIVKQYVLKIESEKEVLGVSDMKGMGLLIKSVKEKVGLRSDGKTISDAVKDILSNQ